MITILPATMQDLSAILDLQKKCYKENALRYNNFSIMPLLQTQKDIEEEFERCTFFKAVDALQIIGSIRAYTQEKTCFIIRLFVHPEYQNCGIGKLLITSSEAHFSRVDRYELFTGYKDTKNLSFYSKCGYSILREETRSDGMRFIFLEKNRFHSKVSLT